MTSLRHSGTTVGPLVRLLVFHCYFDAGGMQVYGGYRSQYREPRVGVTLPRTGVTGPEEVVHKHSNWRAEYADTHRTVEVAEAMPGVRRSHGVEGNR